MRKFLWFAVGVAGLEAVIALFFGLANLQSSPTESAVLLGLAASAVGILMEVLSLANTPRTRMERVATWSAIFLLALGVAVVSGGVVETIAPGVLPGASVLVALITAIVAFAPAVKKLASS